MMRHAYTALLVLLALPAAAQVSPEEQQARIEAVVRQRNAAQDEAAVLAAQLALAQKQIAELQAKIQSHSKKD